MERRYKYDGHMHTAETSKCGRIHAADLVDRYKAGGYDGIVITDHLHEDYISLLYCYDDWDTCVDRYLDGYRRAKKRGDEVGLAVMLGAELRFPENDNDYLVYGIDEAWLRQNPYPFRMGPEAFWKRFGEELLIIHAHPFRDGCSFIRWDCIHGLEVVNTHPDHENNNDKALEAFRDNPALYPLCGSDVHRKGQECAAWVLTEQPVYDSRGYKAAIEQGACRPGGYTLGCKSETDAKILEEAAKIQREYHGQAR